MKIDGGVRLLHWGGGGSRKGAHSFAKTTDRGKEKQVRRPSNTERIQATSQLTVIKEEETEEERKKGKMKKGRKKEREREKETKEEIRLQPPNGPTPLMLIHSWLVCRDACPTLLRPQVFCHPGFQVRALKMGPKARPFHTMRVTFYPPAQDESLMSDIEPLIIMNPTTHTDELLMKEHTHILTCMRIIVESNNKTRGFGGGVSGNFGFGLQVTKHWCFRVSDPT